MFTIDETYSIKLDGNRKYGGRVIFDGYDADYRICTHSWTLVEAEMVCRHMGYQTAIAATKYPNNEDINDFYNSVYFNCERSHNSLHECIQGHQMCSLDPWDAGVVCSNSKKLIFCCFK